MDRITGVCVGVWRIKIYLCAQAEQGKAPLGSSDADKACWDVIQ